MINIIYTASTGANKKIPKQMERQDLSSLLYSPNFDIAWGQFAYEGQKCKIKI